MAAVWMAISCPAHALPILWTFSGVQFDDGGTLSGSLVFDADAGTPCSGGFSPCGVFSNINISTTTGFSRTGTNYSFVCGIDVPSCNGVVSDSTEALLLTSNSSNQFGLPALQLIFTEFVGAPPLGLSDAGGSIDFSGPGPFSGGALEASCGDVTCSSAGPALRGSLEGTLSATPEPSPVLLLGAGLAVFGLVGLRKRHSGAA